MNISDIYGYIETRLSEAGIEDAGSEARIILRETAGLGSTDIHMRPEEELSASVISDIENIINRRLMREPLQYIYGRWDFMGLSFAVKPGVLIPRPDTEILVETALRSLHDGMRILDLCTGTGCILISLLKYSNDCEGVGTDISPDALVLARMNAEEILGNAGFGEAGIYGNNNDRYSFARGDLYEALDGGHGRFDIIVSNPPYISSGVIETLAPEVRDHEPHLALDGGPDGLDILRRIIDGAPAHLIKGGELFLEIGYDQGEAVSRLMREAGFGEVEVIKDYAGLDRVVTGRLPML